MTPRWHPQLSAACDQLRHKGCSGCEGCPCHHVPPPRNFRELVKAMSKHDAKDDQ